MKDLSGGAAKGNVTFVLVIERLFDCKVQTYPPIKDFGLIGDLHTAALVSKNGSIDWCRWPDFDSPAVFCKLLDARLGVSFAISPLNNFVSSQKYVDGTNVLQTFFETDSGTIKLIDFMAVSLLLSE